METTQKETKNVPSRKLEDAANHADEVRELVRREADRIDSELLHLAARNLDHLNEELSELAYGDA
jgi:hypothetical protein